MLIINNEYLPYMLTCVFVVVVVAIFFCNVLLREPVDKSLTFVINSSESCNQRKSNPNGISCGSVLKLMFVRSFVRCWWWRWWLLLLLEIAN